MTTKMEKVKKEEESNELNNDVNSMESKDLGDQTKTTIENNVRKNKLVSHHHNKWTDKKGKSTSYNIRSMCITAIMLALYVVFCYIGNTFIHLTFLSSFLNLDFSLIFLIILVFICKWQWWLFAGIVGGLANFIWAGAGGYVGAIFNVTLNLISLSFMLLMKTIFIPNDLKLMTKKYFLFQELKPYSNKKKNKLNLETRILIICIISFVYLVLVNCLLNGIIFTPLYLNLYYPNTFTSISFLKVEEIYNSTSEYRWFLLWFPDYWTGVFVLYSAFNAIKFSIVLILSFVLISLRYRTKIVDNYFLS